MFWQKPASKAELNERNDFNYLADDDHYFDVACQSLRPQVVIDAEVNYYHHHNSCGHRVKYDWGVKTDNLVEQTRKDLLTFIGKKSSEYSVAFTLNTTFGINAVLHQLPISIGSKKDGFSKVVTSEIEHNSVFLTTMVFAQRRNLKRIILPRADDGSLLWKSGDLDNAIVVVNTMSNIDGRELVNVKELCEAVHRSGGLLLLDSCQSLAHNHELLKSVKFDAAFGSGHKMYGPSVGFMIVSNQLIKKLESFWIGGSTVSDVNKNSFSLIDSDDELYARLEPGLQNYAGIIGLDKAIQWKQKFMSKDGLSSEAKEEQLILYLDQVLEKYPRLHRVSLGSRSVVSLYGDDIDGHELGLYLAHSGVMCRTGYHCCHYYLQHLRKLPPLLRISLGLHNSVGDIEALDKALSKALKAS